MSIIHHAELIRCSSVESFVPDFIVEESEVSEMIADKFGIDDAKELVRLAHNRPINSDQLTLLVRTQFITLEAQNALLKVLEEPPLSTRFIFIVPLDLNLLSTLKSRVNERASSAQEKNMRAVEVFDEFLVANYKDRLSLIEKSVKAKDLEWQRFIKQGLTYHILDFTKEDRDLIITEYVTRTLLTRGASNKMLLEHLALAL